MLVTHSRATDQSATDWGWRVRGRPTNWSLTTERLRTGLEHLGSTPHLDHLLCQASPIPSLPVTSLGSPRLSIAVLCYHGNRILYRWTFSACSASLLFKLPTNNSRVTKKQELDSKGNTELKSYKNQDYSGRLFTGSSTRRKWLAFNVTFALEVRAQSDVYSVGSWGN